MILTGLEIIKEVRKGNIIIAPFDKSMINPNSYNYHLGDDYIEFDEDEEFNVKTGNGGGKRQKFLEERLLLEPNKLYLFNTLEKIGSSKFVTSLIGKSSMGRLGVFLQISANLGHQSEIHRWTLEIRVVKPIWIYPRMVIGQITFWETSGELFQSRGNYTNFDEPSASLGINHS